MFFCQNLFGKRANPLKRLGIKKLEFGIKDAYNILYILDEVYLSAMMRHGFQNIGNKESGM
jgi:hypothetical protein